MMRRKKSFRQTISAIATTDRGFKVIVDRKQQKILISFDAKKEYFRYSHITVLQDFNFDAFLSSLEAGDVLIDIDARTGHNHGTKFRLRPNKLKSLYRSVLEIE